MPGHSASAKLNSFPEEEEKIYIFFYFYLNSAELPTTVCNFWLKVILASEN